MTQTVAWPFGVNLKQTKKEVARTLPRRAKPVIKKVKPAVVAKTLPRRADSGWVKGTFVEPNTNTGGWNTCPFCEVKYQGKRSGKLHISQKHGKEILSDLIS